MNSRSTYTTTLSYVLYSLEDLVEYLAMTPALESKIRHHQRQDIPCSRWTSDALVDGTIEYSPVFNRSIIINKNWCLLMKHLKFTIAIYFHRVTHGFKQKILFYKKHHQTLKHNRSSYPNLKPVNPFGQRVRPQIHTLV